MLIPEKEIIRGNTIIALFDGWRQTIENPQQPDWWVHPEKSIFISDNLQFPTRSPISMKYHKSFDELLPIVERIERGDYGVKMCRKVVEIYRDSTKEELIRVKKSSRMESLWYALIEFIEWCEKNNVVDL